MARERCGASFRCFQTSYRVGRVPWAKQAGLPGPKGLFPAGLRESERPCPSPRGVLSLADRLWPSALGPLTRAAVGLAQGQCSKWTRGSCGLDPCASGTARPLRALLLERSLLMCRSFVSQDRWFLPGCLWLKFLQWKEALDRNQGVNLVTSRGPHKPWGTVYTGQGSHVGRALGTGMTQPGSLGREEEGSRPPELCRCSPCWL